MFLVDATPFREHFMPSLDIHQLAIDLLGAQRQANFYTPPSKRDARFDLQAGYVVAAEMVRLRRQKGYKTVGRKIGFTNKTIWSRLGLDTPIWAHVYESTVHYAAHNLAKLSLAGTVAPRIEPEIVFKLSSPLPYGGTDPKGILEAVEWVALDFEIVDCHYPDWNFKPADAVADFGVHAALVIGEPRALERKKIPLLATQLREFRVSLLRNGETVAEGNGENVLGSPALSLGYLADVLRQQPEAEPLSAGEIVTTGTLTSALPVKPGETWSVEVTGIELPSVTVTLTSS